MLSCFPMTPKLELTRMVDPKHSAPTPASVPWKAYQAPQKHLWDVQLSTPDEVCCYQHRAERDEPEKSEYIHLFQWVDGSKRTKGIIRKAHQGTIFAGKRSTQKFHWVAVAEQLCSCTLLLQASTLLPLPHFYRA